MSYHRRPQNPEPGDNTAPESVVLSHSLLGGMRKTVVFRTGLTTAKRVGCMLSACIVPVNKKGFMRAFKKTMVIGYRLRSAPKPTVSLRALLRQLD
jgi:hypothetical protein